ncbi:DUF3500 domain-containing protein [Paraburkholderia guartelaensis]|uniref:DUF3500 domain-containing protein n=1 Tax=Paraburkholderia guartelaensis TaxID=2546446 RepID=UPI002AB6B3DC|nr:DUF3500 domain-containing protein [Paraburkholderia guartelaensis]
MALAGLAEPFRGISHPGSLAEDVTRPAATGASLAPVLNAARAFVASLDATQRRTACLAIEHEAWRQWSNFHPWLMPRNGLCLADLGHSQRAAALTLMRETMSEEGYRTARDVMRLNEHALEITGKPDEYSEWYYWISIFGTPSENEPWGWQIDGHHLNINCFVLGDQLVMTPILMGSEPVLARFGKYSGLRVFAAEEEQGHALMRALSSDARQQATIGTDLPWEVFAGAYNDNRHIEPGGIRYGDLPQEGRERLEALLARYIGYIRPGHSELRWAQARRHLVDTCFAWIGPFDDTSPFYYRILSPAILVEFDHQPGIVFDNDKPSRDHIHTLVRTPNGKDYGKDLLRQHYLQWHANEHGAHTNTVHKS